MSTATQQSNGRGRRVRVVRSEAQWRELLSKFEQGGLTEGLPFCRRRSGRTRLTVESCTVRRHQLRPEGAFRILARSTG